MRSSANPLDTPMYSPALASRLIDLSTGRVRRWLRGYQYTHSPALGAQPQTRTKEPVVHRHGTEGSPYASFLDLIELLFVKKFVDKGFSLQCMRRALNEAKGLVGGHHFAQRAFWTDGRNIYLEVSKSTGALMQLLTQGQWAIADVIKETAQQIHFSEDTGFAEKWFPLGQEGHVVVDPRVAFGSPSLTNRGIETANVYDLFKAEDENLEVVSSWMQIREEEVQAAVQFEQMLAAA